MTLWRWAVNRWKAFKRQRAIEAQLALAEPLIEMLKTVQGNDTPYTVFASYDMRDAVVTWLVVNRRHYNVMQFTNGLQAVTWGLDNKAIPIVACKYAQGWTFVKTELLKRDV